MDINESKKAIKSTIKDVLIAITAGLIVSVAYYFFQNSNEFAPGGVGGLATITYHLLNANGISVSWAVLMIAFNAPIFVLVSIFVNKKLGLYLLLYLTVQSLGTELFALLKWTPYSALTAKEDFEIVFACVAAGVISGVGFSIMLRRFGASGGTYAISALIKKARPATNIAYVSFILDASVVGIAFFVYGMRIAPVMCTLINLFIANVVVDNMLTGIRSGYKFELITENPEEIAQDIITHLGRGVTEIRALGMYSHKEKYMLVCIISKKQIGKMMKIIQKYPGTFADFSKVNEIFGRFRR